jgi:hypothetical protein
MVKYFFAPMHISTAQANKHLGVHSTQLGLRVLKESEIPYGSQLGSKAEFCGIIREIPRVVNNRRITQDNFLFPGQRG